MTPSQNVQQITESRYCFSPTETTIYTVQSTDEGCNEVEIEIRVWNELNSECIEVNLTEADIYPGEQACVEVSGIGGYTWSPNTGINQSGDTFCFSPTQTTTYTLRSTIAGCDEERQVEIRVWNELDPIPTMSEWGLLIFGLLILNVSIFLLRRREEILEFN